LNELHGKDVSKHIEVEPVKGLVIIVNEKFITACMPDMTVDYVMKNIDTDEIRDIFYARYVSSKLEANGKFRSQKKDKNALHEHFLKIAPQSEMKLIMSNNDIAKADNNVSDSDFCLYLNDVDDNKVAPENNILILKIMESIKFRIRSSQKSIMQHNIEVFRTKYYDYFSCVSRFHLPCVRGYYSGDNVYMLPSCISALMTFTNIEYKYFAGTKNPIEIINKYLQRGFGTILNGKEKDMLVDYNSSTGKWKEVFGIHRNRSAIKEMFAPKKLGDSVFKVSKHFDGLPDNIYRPTGHVQYVMNFRDLVDVYKTQYGFDNDKASVKLLNFKGINERGYLEPVKMWLLDAAFDTITTS
jgi:hypothetical protein